MYLPLTYPNTHVHCVPKKVSHLMFDNNLANMGRFSKFFHQVIRKKNSLCTYNKDFHLSCNMLPKLLSNIK